MATLLVCLFCAFLFSESRVELTSVLLPETGLGPLANAAIFVVASGFGATMVYILLKRGVLKFLRLLMGAAFSILTFALLLLYSDLVFMIVDVEFPLVGALALIFALTAFVVVEIFYRKGKWHAFIILTLGGATGALLGASIPMASAVLILVLLAVYDVVAVFRGPVGKIASRGLEHLPGASFTFENLHVGLGDLTFYSMLVSRIFLSFGWQTSMAAVFGVLMGAFLSFKMVERKGLFPGLPFSVCLGLLSSFVVSMST